MSKQSALRATPQEAAQELLWRFTTDERGFATAANEEAKETIRRVLAWVFSHVRLSEAEQQQMLEHLKYKRVPTLSGSWAIEIDEP